MISWLQIYQMLTLRGVDLSPKVQQHTVFKNKAYLMRGVTQSSEAELVIKEDIFGSKSCTYIFR